MTAREELVESLMQLGFERDRCEQAVEIHGSNSQAATEWLVATSSSQGSAAQPDNPSVPAGWQSVYTSAAPVTVPQSTLQSPLDVLSAVDVFKIHDSGDGWVVVNNNAEPLCFACEESTWYGKLFAGKMRQAEFMLLDVNRRPIVSIKKPFAWTSQGATVSMILHESSGAQGDTLGSIQQEFDLVQRRLLVTDATPNHAAGTLVVEAALTDPVFKVKLNGEELGRIVQPRHGMGVAILELSSGALDPFRSNRMRALLLCATLMVCDMYWSMAPGAATYLKIGLPH